MATDKNFVVKNGLTSTGDILLDSSNAEINIKSGVGGTTGAVNWTFNTDSTNYVSLKIPYDTRGTTGFHIDSGYPLTLDAASGYINFAINGNTRFRVSNTDFEVGTTPIIDTSRNLKNLNFIDATSNGNSGTGSQVIKLRNPNDSAYTADALTAYNATTSWDISDRVTLSLASRAKKSSIYTYLSESSDEAVALERFVQLNSSNANSTYGMKSMWFYQYDGTGTAATDMKKPNGKLLTINTYEVGSTEEQLSLNSDGDLTVGGTIDSGAITATAPIKVLQPSSSAINELLVLEADDPNADIIMTDNTGSVRLRTHGNGDFVIFTGGSATSQNASGATTALTINQSQNATFAGTIDSGAITSTGVVTINEELSGDASQLVIANTQGATLRMGITGSGANEAAHIKTNSGEDLEFHIGQAANSATPRVIFDSSGNVGIGTSSPQTKLHIEGNNVGIPTTYGGVVYEAVDAQIDVISDSSGTWGSAINFVEAASSSANTDVWSIARKTTGGSGDSSLNFNFGTANTHENTNRVAFSSSGAITTAGTISSGSIESTGTINIDTADTTLPNTYFSAERFNDANGKLIFGVGELDPAGGTIGETYIGNHNRRVHIGAVFDGTNHVPTADIMHMMIDSDGDLYVSQNNTHTRWFDASTRNLSNIGTINSDKHIITSTGTIGVSTPANGYLQVTDGTNTLALDPNEIYSTDNLIISTGGDFDIRNGSFSMGNQIVITSSLNLINIGTIDSGAITITTTGSGDLSHFNIDGADANYDFRSNSTSGYTTTFNMDNTGLEIGHNSSGRNLALRTNSTDRIIIGGNGGVAFQSNNLTSVGTISSGVISVNGGTTNVVATFQSTDGIAGIKLQDSAGNVELSVSGSTFRVQPSGGTPVLEVDSSGNTDITGTISSGTITSSGGFRQATAGNDGLRVFGGNANQPLIRVSANAIGNDSGDYGFTLAYRGDRSGNENSLAIYSDNQDAASQVEAINIKQDGATTFASTVSAPTVDATVLKADDSGTTPGSCKLHVGALNNVGSSAIAQFGGFIRASQHLIIHESAGSSNSVLLSYTNGDTDFRTGEGAAATPAVRVNSLKIGTSTVIDASRNLSNIGTISSGAITSSGAIFAGDTTGTAGGLVLAQRYSGNDNLATLGTMYSSGAWLLGYGIKPKNAADGYASSFDNFSGTRAYLEFKPNAFKIGYAAAQQTTVGSDITGLSTPFNFDPSTGNLSITGDINLNTVGQKLNLGTTTGTAAYIRHGDDDNNVGSVSIGSDNNIDFIETDSDVRRFRFETNNGNSRQEGNHTIIGNIDVHCGAQTTGTARIRSLGNAGDPALEFSDNGGDQHWAIGADDRDVGYFTVRFNGSTAFPTDWTSNGSMCFEINGGSTNKDIVFNGNVTAYSDIRIKENIEQIPDALSKVHAIRGITYDRINSEDGRRTGVIAQEVEAVLPEVVRESSDGIKSVDYGNMVGLLIEAIKEQQKDIDKLKEEVLSLRSKN